MTGLLMGLFGWGSEWVAPRRRAVLGLESLDGRVMPAAMVIGPPRGGEEIPTVTRAAGEEIPQSDRGEVSVCRSRGSTEEIPQGAVQPGGGMSLDLTKQSGEELPQSR